MDNQATDTTTAPKGNGIVVSIVFWIVLIVLNIIMMVFIFGASIFVPLMSIIQIPIACILTTILMGGPFMLIIGLLN